MNSLQTNQAPPLEVMLTTLLNDLANIKDQFILVFDDYHVINAEQVAQAPGCLFGYARILKRKREWLDQC